MVPSIHIEDETTPTKMTKRHDLFCKQPTKTATHPLGIWIGFCDSTIYSYFIKLYYTYNRIQIKHNNTRLERTTTVLFRNCCSFNQMYNLIDQIIHRFDYLVELWNFLSATRNYLLNPVEKKSGCSNTRTIQSCFLWDLNHKRRISCGMDSCLASFVPWDA